MVSGSLFEFIYTLDSWGLLLLQVCRAREKLLFLVALLQQFRDQRTIVFTASVEATHRLFLLLRCFYNDEAHVVAEYSSKGSETVRRLVRKSSSMCYICFVSNKHQPLSARNHSLKCGLLGRKALEEFRRGTVHVMVASDALTRGMDVEGIANVVNYDVPVYVKTYVHRVGRTARAGQAGRAFTLMVRKEVCFP
jgi:ATP-dependent RNA helicase DDX51/DBP6